MRAEHVVIIGAPRSGTNMLRDWLCEVDGIATWPCDEINYIWRHGNLRYPSDQFSPDMATPPVQRYIRRKFGWVERRFRPRIVVEKTCANSLRVGFVERALDAPKYLFIYRDGIDATASAMKRWTAKLDLPYLARKARFVPMTDLPYYATRYLASRLAKLRSKEERLSTWGPVIPGMQELARTHALPELCALQWQACVERALDDFETIPGSRVMRISYEGIVEDKDAYAARIADFLAMDVAGLRKATHFQHISPRSVGRGAGELPDETLARIRDIVTPVMRRLGSA